jgi:hypothetical protein
MLQRMHGPVGTQMSYFDRLNSVYFKTARDGRKLYFPWGLWGRGYVVPSEQDYERLRRQLKTFWAVYFALIIPVCAGQYYIAAFVLAVLITAFYAAWSRHLAAGLEVTNERLSLREAMASQARAYNALTLWSLELAALAFVACGIVILADDPSNWPIAIFSVGFGGYCAAYIAYVLVLRGRATP